MHRVQDFILWHYKNGSMYDTPILAIMHNSFIHNELELFEHIEKCSMLPRLFDFEDIRDTVEYAYWEPSSYNCWNKNV